jgi:hypothetical protein
MRILKSYWTTRTALLIMLLIALTASIVILVPAKAYAACCGWRTTERYYSDATFTTQVGTCIDDECAGTYTCTGTQTAYETATQTCCDRCLP